MMMEINTWLKALLKQSKSGRPRRKELISSRHRLFKLKNLK
jgi:hypothetical protein